MAVGDAFKNAVTKAGLDAARESAQELAQALKEAQAAAAALKPPPTPSQAAAAEVRRLGVEARQAAKEYEALRKAQEKALNSFSSGAKGGSISPWATGPGGSAVAPKMPAPKAGAKGAPGVKGAVEDAEKGPEKAGGDAFKAPKDLKYLLKHAGIGKAAMSAMGAAAGLELTKLALGYKGMAQLSAISARTGLQIRQLFAGVDPSPVVRSADRFFNTLFNKAGPAGKALSGIFDRAFNSLFGAVEKAEPTIQAFFEGVIIGALKIEEGWYRARLALLPFTDAIADALPEIDGISAAATAGGLALAGLGVYATAAAAPFLPLAAAILAVTKALEQFSKLQKEIEGAGGFAAAAKGMARHFMEGTGKEGEDAAAARGRAAFDEAEAKRRAAVPGGGAGAPAPTPAAPAAGQAGMATGKAYADGLAKGVGAGQPGVDAAGAAAGQGLDTATRGALKIKSPSKVGEETGGQYPAGIAQGVDKRAPEAKAAMARAAAPPPSTSTPGVTAGPAATTFPDEALALLRQIEANTRPRSSTTGPRKGWGDAVHTISSILAVDHSLAGA